MEPRPPEEPSSHVKMKPEACERSFQGCIRMPRIPVIRPPVLKLIHLGKALAKSFAGETTLAAMLTASVATAAVNLEETDTIGALNRPTSCTGSQIGWP